MTRTVFLDSTQDVVDVVGEEALRVKHRLDQAGDGPEGHVFRVRVAVPLKCAVSTRPRKNHMLTTPTSSLCLTFFKNMFPSAANPFTASTARSVLRREGRARRIRL